MQSHTLDLDGPVHYVDHGGSGPTIVCVHGLGGSALNWRDVAPLLTGHARVIAVDLAGHGSTPRAGRSAHVRANRGLLHRFLAEVVGGPAILMGNSMGGLISLMQAEVAPATVAGLILVDPAIPGPLTVRPDPQVLFGFAVSSVPGVALRLMTARRRKLGPAGQVKATLNMCTVDRTRVNPETVALTIAAAERRADDSDALEGFIEASRSVVTTIGRRTPLLRAMASVRVPVLLIHGESDRLVNVAAARQAAAAYPQWSYVEVPDIGHVPQMEAPVLTAETVLGWLDGAGRPARDAAAVTSG